MAESLGPFDVWKVPETQKHAKIRKSTSQCQYQMKGDYLETPPESMANKSKYL
jgi:hypothetical protein